MRPIYAAAIAFFAAAPAYATCIDSRDIDSTSRPDDHTLIFHLRDHTDWKGTFPVACPNLKTAVDGFVLNPTDPDTGRVCEGMATIRLNDQGHATCTIQNITRIK